MYWVIRWTDKVTGEDQAIVVEAKSRTLAETIALKRDIPVVFIGPADDDDVAAAREAKLLWRYTPDSHWSCFGQPVGTRQLACLMLCGIWTIGLLLQSAGVLIPRIQFQF
jgi:hypothetical protein